MLSLKLCNARTEIDLDRLSEAFSISRTELEHGLRLGMISYWYEVGASDEATPQMVFRSRETGRLVVLDRIGKVVSGRGEGATPKRPESKNRMSGSTEVTAREGLEKTAAAAAFGRTRWRGGSTTA